MRTLLLILGFICVIAAHVLGFMLGEKIGLPVYLIFLFASCLFFVVAHRRRGRRYR